MVLFKTIQRIWDTVIQREYLLFFISVQNILGIVVVFSSPLPLRPKTSIGLSTGVAVCELILFIFLAAKKQLHMQKKIRLIDWLVVGYIIVNALSLLKNPYIFDLTSFRLLLVATVHFFIIRLMRFSDKEQKRAIYVIGLTTLGISAISLFQVAFRDQAILFAKKFLFGDAAYSIAQDLSRGRGPQWGDIVVSYAFFIGSAVFLKKSHKLLHLIYVLSGIFLIPFSFIISNFRWLTLCFLLGSIFYTGVLLHTKLLSVNTLRKILIPIGVAAAGALILASLVFRYSLIDRFLLKEKERDVSYTLGRTFLYGQAISAFLASPLVGIGAGNYQYEVERPVRLHFYDKTGEFGENEVREIDREAVSSHNDLLTVLAETGVLGIFIYITINFLVLKRVRAALCESIKKKSERQIIYSLTFYTSLVMFYLIGLFENTAPNNFIFVYFLYAAITTWL